MGKIRIAIVGMGNCASALVQGIHYYQNQTPDQAIGLMHYNLGGYRPEDIQVVAAFDIDRRKVGQDVSAAVFALPNCTIRFTPDIPLTGVTVHMGCVLDGISDHMMAYDEEHRFCIADQKEADREKVVRILKESKTQILLNYLPVGAEQATLFYVSCSLEAKVAFINNIPVFIASNRQWADRFKRQNLPLIGDDIKSQLGATIVHRVLTDLFKKRGVSLDRTYQLNTGGNTDFLNMLNHHRLKSKKKSKTEAVQAVADQRLPKENIHIGPSDYIPWQKDNKVCFLRMEGRLFGNVPMNLDLRLQVEDSPNSAGVVIDIIRCARLALDNQLGGVLEGPSAFFCKHPPHQYEDGHAYEMTEAFIAACAHA